MNKHQQLGFDFEDKDRLEEYAARAGNGYDAWAAERQAAINEVNRRFGAMINRRVRLKLWCSREEYQGKLLLNSLLPPMSKDECVPLRIGRATFYLNDVEYCMRIPESET